MNPFTPSKLKQRFLFLATTILTCSLCWTSVWAGADYEEVTYDDLVNQLSRKKTSVQSVNDHPFDEILFHAGFGLITSSNSVRVTDHDQTKFQNGFQLSLGVDLFSDSWATEGVIRNFGTANSGTESRSLREFDLKVLHRTRFNNNSGLRYGAGLGTRYFKLSDPRLGVYIDDSTPVTTLFGGFDTYFSRNLSLGIEAGLRSAMITRTSDKNAFDITFRLDTYF